ncbi:rolling circle replication-associated protein [Luteimonas panaciterrae]|uniref:rolling circle replication-associated protein n=1 Tax=Luteimonas panaciterrae TaxID=363885 RepID=UPI003CCD6924
MAFLRTSSGEAVDEAPAPSKVRGHVELLDQPELYGVADTATGDAWSEFLRRYPAHVFATLTFRREKFYTDRTGQVRAINRTGSNGSMHPEAADKAFRYFVRCINESVYGNNWQRQWHRGLQWARGQEFHKDGRLHFHALLAAPTADLNHLISRYQWHEWWYREFGRNQIEQPRSQHDVAAYVSKYVVKDGTVDFSPNFGAWRPPRPDFSVVPQQRDLPGSRTTDPAPVD